MRARTQIPIRACLICQVCGSGKRQSPAPEPPCGVPIRRACPCFLTRINMPVAVCGRFGSRAYEAARRDDGGWPGRRRVATEDGGDGASMKCDEPRYRTSRHHDRSEIRVVADPLLPNAIAPAPIGHIVGVRGPVVEIACERLPPLRQALLARFDHDAYLFEVHQHLDERHLRAVTLHGTAGLQRGMAVYDTGAPLHVPVSADCLGRVEPQT